MTLIALCSLAAAGQVQAQAAASVACFKVPELDRMPPSGRVASAKFFAALTFAGDPEDAPSIEVLHSTLPPEGRAFMLEFLGSFRNRCRKAGDPPFHLDQPFHFFKRGVQPVRFKDPAVGLSRFLDLMKAAPDEQVSLNLDDMGCPFTVRWTTLRPAAPNRAKIAGSSVPAREPLLRWMASLELDASDESRDRLIGESMDVRIPCGRIELSPPPGPSSNASSPSNPS